MEMKRSSLFLIIITFLVSNAALADLSTGLVARYDFNGNANDLSGYGNHGTVYGATLTADRFGNANSAYRFDGVNDYIDCGSGSSMLFNSSDSFTLSAWIKHSASTTLDSIVARHDDRYGTFNYALAVSGDRVDDSWCALLLSDIMVDRYEILARHKGLWVCARACLRTCGDGRCGHRGQGGFSLSRGPGAGWACACKGEPPGI